MMSAARAVPVIEYDMKLDGEKQNVHDKLYDSRKGFSVYYRFEPRSIHEMCNEFKIPLKINSRAINRFLQQIGTCFFRRHLSK